VTPNSHENDFKEFNENDFKCKYYFSTTDVNAVSPMVTAGIPLGAA